MSNLGSALAECTAIGLLSVKFKEAIDANTFSGSVEPKAAACECTLLAHELLIKALWYTVANFHSKADKYGTVSSEKISELAIEIISSLP